jgi:hypothetical protein
MRISVLFDVALQADSREEDRAVATRSTVMLGRPSPNRQARQQDRRQFRRNILLLAFLFPLSTSGCYWLKYGKLMRTHVELLLSMAQKMSDLLEDRRTITPTMMNEFSYPLDRARDFVRIVGQRYAERGSLQAFVEFLDTYTELVKETEQLRMQNEGMDGFHDRLVALREQGAQVKAILKKEGW